MPPAESICIINEVPERGKPETIVIIIHTWSLECFQLLTILVDKVLAARVTRSAFRQRLQSREFGLSRYAVAILSKLLQFRCEIRSKLGCPAGVEMEAVGEI